MKKDKKKENTQCNPEEQCCTAEDTAEVKDEETVSEEIVTKKDYDDLLDRYQRLFAEFDNFRKRSQKEWAAASDNGSRAALLKLLPVFDNLERAMQTAKNTDDPLFIGIQLTMKILSQVFESLGVSVIPSVGETFNPDLHEAVMHETSEEHGEAEIVLEMQKGYMYKEKVLRYSMVKVVN